MPNGQEIISALNNPSNPYGQIRLKGVFFHHGEEYYPIKILFIPTDKHVETTVLDYGDLLLIDREYSTSEVATVVQNLGERHEITISPFKIVLPRGYFRNLEEDSSKIGAEYGGYSPLSEFESKHLRHYRSYPKSTFRQWPTRTYLFQFQYDPTYSTAYSRKSSQPLPVKNEIPLLPDYHSAIRWWLGNDFDYLNDGKIIFYLPDVRARISDIKIAKDEFIVKSESRLAKIGDLRGKYYVSYERMSPDIGDLDFSKPCHIAIKEDVQRIYVILYDKNTPSNIIDYRDYNLRYSREDDLDIEYEESNIEYWLVSGESADIEFKLEVEDKKTDQFIESVCSFSNTYGGRIFIGVDDNGNVKGLDENQIAKYQQRMPDWIRNWIEPQPQATIEVVDVRGKALIMVTVPKGNDQPYNYRDHGVYIRAGATDRIATRDELVLLMPGDTKQPFSSY